VNDDMAEAFLAGLIGFLIGRGIEPKDATAVVEALRTYLGFEPPLGLTGYALQDIVAGQEANAAVVVRGRAYDVVALEQIPKHSQVSVLSKKGERLEVAPTIESLMLIKTIQTINLIESIEEIKRIHVATTIPNYIRNGDFEAGVFSPWITVETPLIVTDVVYEGKYSARIEMPTIGVTSSIMQNLPPIATDALHFSLWHNTTNGKTVSTRIRYTDATESNHPDAGAGEWKFQFITPTAAKYLKDIWIRPIDSGTISYVDDVRCV